MLARTRRIGGVEPATGWQVSAIWSLPPTSGTSRRTDAEFVASRPFRDGNYASDESLHSPN